MLQQLYSGTDRLSDDGDKARQGRGRMRQCRPLVADFTIYVGGDNLLCVHSLLLLTRSVQRGSM